jgi:type IV secretory pathway VirB2 component (pilin)
MAIAPSLFDTPASAPLSAASGWITGTVLGSLAISLCVIAVAFVGLMLMSGRLPIRDAVRVVIGCFVLLGAPVIAVGLRGVADEAAVTTVPQSKPSLIMPPEAAPRAPSTYDPYAGASLRTE